MSTFDAICQPQSGHGLQAMMLRWEKLHPVNAVHIAWLQNAIDPLAMQAAITRVIGRLLKTSGSQSIDCSSTGGELFEFHHATIVGDWRSQLESAVSDELNTPYAPGKSPFRISLFDVPNEGQFLVVGYRHVVADGRSISLLLHEIIHKATAPAAESYDFETRLDAKGLRQLFPAEYSWRRIPEVAWSSASSLWKSLWCRRLPPNDPGDLNMEFRFHQTALPVAVLKNLSHRFDVTFNDLILASLLEWLARTIPANGSRRRYLGVASLVDVNSRAPLPQADAFGQYLSPFVVRVPVTADMPFNEIVRLIAEQSKACKAVTPLIMTARGFEFLCREWDLIPRVRRPEHLPWALPLLAGVSNVNLRPIVGRAGGALPVQNYFRGMCVTNLLPMMLGVTTLRDTCTLTTTHRTAVFSALQMDDLAANIGWRLFGVEKDQSSVAA